MFSTQARGQVGVGTLIIFIAMVLVAAIAAGVLISTAGVMQSQGQQTGEETTKQVSGGVDLGTGTGRVTNITTNYNGVTNEIVATDDLVNEIRITVSKSPGSDPVNLTKMTILYNSQGETQHLIHESKAENATIADSGTPFYKESGDAAYLIEAVDKDNREENSTVLNERHSTYQIVIPLGITYYTSKDETSNTYWIDDRGRPDLADAIIQDDYFPEYNTIGGAASQLEYPHTLRDLTANQIGSNDFDKVTFDNTQLSPLPGGKRVIIKITTPSGSERRMIYKTPEYIDKPKGGSVML